MASTSYTLSRTAYTSVASADDVVSVKLPQIPFRVGRLDRVELILATAAPTVPDPVSAPHRDSIVLENSPEQFGVLANVTVPTGEALYARWLGEYSYEDESGDDSSLYVVTF